MIDSPTILKALISIVAAAGAIIIVVPTIRFLRDVVPFAYPTARVRARMGRLFTDRQLTEVMETENLKEFKNYLRGFPDYAKYIDEYPIEKALESQLAEIYQLITEIVPKRLKRVFEVQSKKWDIKNIKSLLTAKDTGLSPEETLDLLIPFGELKDKLEKLTELKTVEDIITAFEDTEYGPILEAALPDYEKTGMLLPFEAALDKYYMETLLEVLEEVSIPKEDTEILRTYFGAQIDATNLKIILRAKADNLKYEDISPYIIEGYQLPEWKLEYLMEAENIKGIISELEGTDYGPVLAEALPEYEETRSLATFERALEKYINETARTFALKRPLGVGPIITFLSRKEAEIKNLKVIARSKREPSFSQPLLKEMLI
ncbi:MAG TPA: ATP synthase A1 subunit C [Methanothermobacter sp.]|jgi:V/A-type H+-transporting ATPase subunit C|uniref:A-type ATP synthase subunit C n=1 Tax=Methanothermobacter tenebrarum TaxID=680118 RepID=A0ABN6PC75_9EURY|nr:ATP synthase A1 subunit C [Methanothermobacter tenebrarum]MDD3453949.1 ATP synthase A1 subunit C [Methanobacteriales archaeon]MDX9692718.1 ATP synthase A1 subunit C [Methanothermobacter sp.]BDH79084.1 ATP synthase subunit C [Methanothermobacter tenebrarum]HHW16981.1 ATP synthase A1 subunit C [Methanothermobacter sp.]